MKKTLSEENQNTEMTEAIKTVRKDVNKSKLNTPQENNTMAKKTGKKIGKKTATKKTSKKTTKKAVNTDGLIPAITIANDAGVDPSDFRKALRSSDISKPEAGWKFEKNSKAHKEAIKLAKSLTGSEKKTAKPAKKEAKNEEKKSAKKKSAKKKGKKKGK